MVSFFFFFFFFLFFLFFIFFFIEALLSLKNAWLTPISFLDTKSTC